MLRSTKSLESFHRNNKIIALVFGGIYALYGLANLGIMLLQEEFIYNEDVLNSVEFAQDIFGPVHDSIRLMMPYLIVIGFGFILFGLLYKSVKSSRLSIALILVIVCTIWSIVFIKNSMEQSALIYDKVNSIMNLEDNSITQKFTDISKYSGMMSLFMTFAYMIGPIAILTLRIKMNDEEN